jgi:hypothetical protein
MHGDASVTEHSLWTCGRHDDLFIYAKLLISVPESFRIGTCQTRILYWVSKRRNDTKLELLLGIVTWHAQKCPLLELFLIDLGQAKPPTRTGL